MDENDTVHIKGSALMSTRRFIESRFGASEWDRVVSTLDDTDRDVLAKRMLASAWYPFSTMVNLMNAIDRLYGKGDGGMCKELGRFSAEDGLNTMYKVFYKLSSPSFIVGRSAAVWKTYYDSGTLTVTEKDDKSVTMVVTGFSAPAREHCLRIQGWMEKACEMSGGREVYVVETRCRCRGSDRCEFRAQWK